MTRYQVASVYKIRGRRVYFFCIGAALYAWASGAGEKFIGTEGR